MAADTLTKCSYKTHSTRRQLKQIVHKNCFHIYNSKYRFAVHTIVWKYKFRAESTWWDVDRCGQWGNPELERNDNKRLQTTRWSCRQATRYNWEGKSEVGSSPVPSRKKQTAALVQLKVHWTMEERDVSAWASPWPIGTLGSSFVQWKHQDS